MKYLILLMLAGCSTTVNTVRVEFQDPKVTVEDLKRASYFLGCAEVQYDGIKSEKDLNDVTKRCRDRSLTWDPSTVGVKQ